MSLLTWLKTKVQRPAVEKTAPRIIELAAYLTRLQEDANLMDNHGVLINADQVDEINQLEELLSSFTDDSTKALTRILRRRLDAFPSASAESTALPEFARYKMIRRLSFKLAKRHILDHTLRLPGRERLQYLVRG